MADQQDGVDFALAAYREEGAWQVQQLAHDVLGDIEEARARAKVVRGWVMDTYLLRRR